MGIKWKKIREVIRSETLNAWVAGLFLVVFIVIFCDCMFRMPRYVKSVQYILLFFVVMMTIVTGLRAYIFRMNKKTESMEDLEYYQTYFKILVWELAACIIYIPVLTLWFAFVPCIPHSSYMYFDELYYYNKTWVIVLSYVVPVFSSLFTVVIECERAKNKRAAQNDARMQAERNKAIAEQDKAKAEQEKANNLRADFITNVTHDLKTPLTAMIGYLALMEKEELSPVMQDYVEAVNRKTIVLKEMIDQILEISKASSGNITLEKEMLNFNKLIKQLVADITETYQEKEIPFKLELTEENTTFVGDNTYAYRIVQNLLVNAVKYSLEGTRIFVRTYVSEGRVFLEIINVSAYPLDDNILDYKAKFARGDKARNTEGHGLGLAIVDAYTQALGGRFALEMVGDTFEAVVDFEVVEKE